MNRRTVSKLWLCTSGVVLSGMTLPAVAAPVVYTDTHGDQVGSTNAARDIWSASIDDDGTDLYITINDNPAANLGTSNFNYGIGLTTGNPAAGGDTSANATTHGNAYNRAISIDPTLGGMLDWIGLYTVGGGGTTANPYQGYGFNDYTFGSTGSTEPAGKWTNIETTGIGVAFAKQTAAFSSPGGSAPSSITVAVPIADFASNLPLTPGSTVKFDIYSTGTSAGQTAYDSLADPSATNGTNSSTTQYNGTVLESYTMNATPAPLSLVWNNATGAGDGATWDMAQSGAAGGTYNQNWLDSTTPFFFFANNAVTFNDSNNATSNGGTNANAYNVTLNSTVRPASVLVNNSLGNYVISGTGVIAGSGSLTKMGSSTLTLSTANTYTGFTTVSGGTLIAGSNTALGSSTAVTAGLSIGAAAVDFTSAAPAIASLTSTSSSASIVLGNSTAPSPTVLTVGGNNASTVFGGVISDLSLSSPTAVGSLVKVGSGMLTLTGANTYTGTTTINGGILEVNANLGGSISTTNPLILGGGTFTVLGQSGAATNVSVGGLTLSSGSGSGFAVDGGNSTSTTLNISGPITASVPGTSLDILTTTSGTTTGIVTTTAPNVNGILSGRIVLNGTDFAANGPTPGTSPIGAPTYTPISTVGGTNSNNSLANNSATLGAGTTTTNSLKVTDTTTGQSLQIGGGNILALTSGGLLFTGANNYSINGGTLESVSASPSDLIINQYGTGTLTIGSAIADGNAPSTLTKTGPGTAVLAGANSYTGTTFVTAGTLVLSGTNTSPSFLVNNATLSLGAIGAVNNESVTLTGSGNLIETAGGLSGAATVTLSSGTPTATLSQPNTYFGNTTISAGTLQLANATAVQNSIVNLNVANGLTFAPGSSPFTLGGLNGSVNLALADTSAGAVTVQLANTTSITYSGVLSGPGGISQVGTGTTTLTAANTYVGLTTATSGTLVATNNSSFGSNTSVTGGLVLNPSTGTATVDFTSAAPNIASLASSGAGTANVVLGNAGATPSSTVLTVGGNNTSTVFSGVISDLTGTATAAYGALTKVGTGSLTLTNANTYTGISTGTPLAVTTGTTFNGGTLVAANVQALGMPTVPLVASPSSTASNTITLDIATDTSIDPYNVTEGNSGTLIIESDKATAASAGITQTLGTLSYGAATLTIAAGPNVSGGSPAVAFGNVTLNSVHNNTTIFNPTTANLILNGTVTSNALTSMVVVLQLDGTSAGNTIAGAISDASAGQTALTKSNSSTWTLSGVSTYTGTTNVNGGTLAVTDTGALASPTINVAFGATANINGLLTGPVPPAATTPPTLAVNGTLNFGAADTHNDSGGGILVRTLTSLSIGTGTNPALVTVSSPVHATRTLLTTSSLTLNGSTGAWTGSLDLTGSDMMIPNGGTPALAQVTNQLQQGFTAPSTGGIYSSTAAANSKHNTALGIEINDTNASQALVYGPVNPATSPTEIANPSYSAAGAATGSFDNQSTNDGDVLVKYTYFGDTNLDGVVNAADYLAIDSAFNTNHAILANPGANPGAYLMSGWVNGDFNSDGLINGDDYTLMDNAFNSQGGVSLLGIPAGPTEMIATDTSQIAGVSTSAVPEPGSLSLLALGAAGLLRRRIRKTMV